MKVLLIVSALILAVSALPVDDSQTDHINGENGWYVPQEDGSFQWVSKAEADDFLNQQEEKEGRRDTNTVRFFLLTNKNPSEQQEIFPNRESIESSFFDPKLPTRFIIHGWQGSGQDDLNYNIADAWLSRGDYNVIAVDWKKARTINYMSSVGFVSKVAVKVAAMINFLNSEFKMRFSNVQCIGHSLGAHTCGYTGKNVNGKLQAIVGLDAALPLFDFDKPHLRLNSEDADYVEAIHTNGGKLGFLKPIGQKDFYMNGGKSQPGCFMDITGSCSHGRSHEYYAVAVKMNNFPSVQCQDYQAAVKKNCGATYSSTRMASPSNFLLKGERQYYVPVSKKYPYGMGSD